jgi:hypothetical protein
VAASGASEALMRPSTPVESKNEASTTQCARQREDLSRDGQRPTLPQGELVSQVARGGGVGDQVFNDPLATFKSESFIVLMTIAWTYMLRAYYRSNKLSMFSGRCISSKS